MSSAKNHAKRSHRSNFRARMFNGGRKSVTKPTLSKSKFMQFIKLIRDYMHRNKETKSDV